MKNLVRKLMVVPLLFAFYVVASSLASGSPLASELELSNIKGGGCYWQQSNYCPTGGGCNAVCGYGVNYGQWSCPTAGLTIIRTGYVFPPSYSSCINSGSGLTDCGLPTSQVTCGTDETCGSGCTAGDPIGALNPKPSVCIRSGSSSNTQNNVAASGYDCFGS